MTFTIPLLVPERVVDWAVRKGYVEFEARAPPAAAGSEEKADDAPARRQAPPPQPAGIARADDAGTGHSRQEAAVEALDLRLVVPPAHTLRCGQLCSVAGLREPPCLLRAPRSHSVQHGRA